jgi:hypothetical protein
MTTEKNKGRVLNEKNINDIFKTLYVVNVKRIDITPIQEIRSYGYRTMDYDTNDKTWMNELVVREIPISTMVEYFSDGVNVRLVKGNDSKAIYVAICDHLSVWNEYLNSRLNHTKAPYKDFKKMGEFADVLYSVAARYGLHDDNVKRASFGETDFGVKSLIDIEKLLPAGKKDEKNNGSETYIEPPHVRIIESLKARELRDTAVFKLHERKNNTRRERRDIWRM